MIALNETDSTAAEVPFYLGTTADPLTGLTGHDFSGNSISGEVVLHLPGGAWFNVLGSQIVEKGFGRYAVQLTFSQCLVAGIVYLRAVVAGAQPDLSDEEIGTGSGDFTVSSAGLFPFYLPDAVNPIYGSPLTGHTFAAGEVKIRLPGSVYVSADVSLISEVGYGAYQLAVLDTQTVQRGKIYLYANVAGAQRFEGFAMILDAVAISIPVVPVTPVVVTSPVAASPAYVDHVSAAVSRLAQEYRS